MDRLPRLGEDLVVYYSRGEGGKDAVGLALVVARLWGPIHRHRHRFTEAYGVLAEAGWYLSLG